MVALRDMPLYLFCDDRVEPGADISSAVEDAGVALEAIRDGLTHSDKKTTVRYIRRQTKRIADIAEARRELRASTGEKDGQ